MVERSPLTNLAEQEHENLQQYDTFMRSSFVRRPTDPPLTLKIDFDQADARNRESVKKPSFSVHRCLPNRRLSD
jgi:hypothetical protein